MSAEEEEDEEHRRTRAASRTRRRESITISFEARDYLSDVADDPSLRLGADAVVRDCLGLREGAALALVVQSQHDEVGAALDSIGGWLGSMK